MGKETPEERKWVVLSFKPSIALGLCIGADGGDRTHMGFVGNDACYRNRARMNRHSRLAPIPARAPDLYTCVTTGKP
jgi:hypothetical protein